MTHTPGPWDLYQPYSNVWQVFPAQDGDDHSICRVSMTYCEVGKGGKNVPSENEANARLIAAAPELLEALEGALIALDADTSRGRESWEDDAREAVAKARGQS